MCGKDDLSDSIAQCQLLTLEDVAKTTHKGRLHELSMHNIDSAFDNVPILDIIRGIFGIMPAETLHVLGTGIIKYMLKAIVQLVGPNESKKTEKETCLIFCTRILFGMQLDKASVTFRG